MKILFISTVIASALFLGKCVGQATPIAHGDNQNGGSLQPAGLEKPKQDFFLIEQDSKRANLDAQTNQEDAAGSDDDSDDEDSDHEESDHAVNGAQDGIQSAAAAPAQRRLAEEAKPNAEKATSTPAPIAAPIEAPTTTASEGDDESDLQDFYDLDREFAAWDKEDEEAAKEEKQTAAQNLVNAEIQVLNSIADVKQNLETAVKAKEEVTKDAKVARRRLLEITPAEDCAQKPQEPAKKADEPAKEAHTEPENPEDELSEAEDLLNDSAELEALIEKELAEIAQKHPEVVQKDK